MPPKVTVLLPAYNGDKFLRESISSVLNQSFRDFELLVVDDCSSDMSTDVVRSISDPRIRLIVNSVRKTLPGALNVGLNAAMGTYVARMDQDDICVPDRLEKQVRFMEAHPEIDIVGGWVKAIGDHPSAGTIFRYPTETADVKATLLFDNPFAHPTVMFRKASLDRLGLRYDESCYGAEDYELWSRALEVLSGANIPSILLHYRLHAKSITMSLNSDMDARAIEILQKLFPGIGLTPSYDEMKFHRLICTNRLSLEWNRDSLEKVERWLAGLVSANARSGRYDQDAFRLVVNRVWFSVAYRSTGLGWCTVRKYFASPLSYVGKDRVRQLCAIIFSYMKRTTAGESQKT